MLSQSSCIVTGSQASAKVSDKQARELGENAYLYGLQQVIFYRQRWISTQDDR
jgi:hypothetical protein